MQKYIEPYINSREVAGMVEKAHNDLLKDIRRYLKQLGQGKITQSDFFTEDTYQNSQNKTMPCYKITKKGCEFIAHKLTGTKGTIFTARYINRFHEMEDIISNKEKEPGLPWFIRKFRGEYIMLFRDFEAITGVHLSGNYTSLKRTYRLIGGYDCNGWGWYENIDKEEFKQKYGFDYGDDQCMYYLYERGIKKALDILMRDRTVQVKEETYKMLVEGIKSIDAQKKIKTMVKIPEKITTDDIKNNMPVNINITIGNEEYNCRRNILL